MVGIGGSGTQHEVVTLALFPYSPGAGMHPFLGLLGLLVDAGHGSGGGQADLGESDVERLPLVVERGRLQDDARRPHQHGHREDPQEEPVEHHRHVLPVLDDLRCKRSSIALIHAIQ